MPGKAEMLLNWVASAITIGGRDYRGRPIGEQGREATFRNWYRIFGGHLSFVTCHLFQENQQPTMQARLPMTDDQ